MGVGAVRVALCLLLLGPGTLLFSTATSAVPASPGLRSSSGDPTGNSPAGRNSFTGIEKHAQRPTGSPIRNTALANSTLGSTQTPTPETHPSIPCVYGALSDQPANGKASGGLCSSPSDGQQRLSIQFGSRIGSHSGMLGELDGIRVDYRLTSGLTLNGVAGYPVLSSNDKFNVNKQMFGINAVTGKFARAWDVNSYMVEQQDKGRVTSRSVGTAVRYLQPKRSLLVFLDYDAFEHALGSLMASGAWKLPYETTFSATLDIRTSPLRKQQLKYLQKTMAASDGWYWILPDSRIKHYTRKRSNEVATLAVGLSHSFSQRVKLTGDVAVMDVSSNSGSAGSASRPAQLSEYFYHLKLSGKDLMIAGDKNTLDLRHQVSDSSTVSSASVHSKYALNRSWNISPKLRADYRTSTPDNSIRWVTSPALKMEYQGRDRFAVQIQAGGEWSASERPGGNESRSSYLLKLGYKAKF